MMRHGNKIQVIINYSLELLEVFAQEIDIKKVVWAYHLQKKKEKKMVTWIPYNSHLKLAYVVIGGTWKSDCILAECSSLVPQ